MKLIWEPEDIEPGRRYSRPSLGETWLIGYVVEVSSGTRHAPEARYVSVSLKDGLTTPPKTAEDLANELTLGMYLPLEYLEAKRDAF